MTTTAQNALRVYAQWIIRYRWYVIGTVLFATLYLGSCLSSLKLDMNPDIWAPQDHPYIQTTKLIERIFGGRNFTIIGIVPKTGGIYQPEILQKIQRIQQGVEDMPEAVRHNIISIAAKKAKAIKGDKDGMEVRRMLVTLPTTPEAINRLKQEIAENPIYVNAVVSPDGKAAAVIADFKLPQKNPSYGALYNSLKTIVDRERDASVDIYLGGLPVEVAWFEFHMGKMPIFFGMALLIIMAIQYWSFRSYQGMILPIATGLVSVIWALGLMSLVGVHMDGMNTTTPILIMAVAAGHAIQILKRYYEEFEARRRNSKFVSSSLLNAEAITESITKVGWVMITIGGIAIIAFYSLTTARIAVVRHFGVFAGTGILAALILELTLIPALRSLLPLPKASKQTGNDWLDHALIVLAEGMSRGRASIILGAAVLVLLIAAGGTTRLQVDSSFKRYNAPGSEVRRSDATLNQYFGGTNSMLFLVDGGRPDTVKDPAVIKGMAVLQQFLESQPHVGKTQSLADLIRRMNKAMHSDNAAYDSIPNSRDLIAQYLFLYSASGDPDDFDNFVDSDYQRAVIWAYLDDDSTAYAEALYKKAQTVIAHNFPPSVHVTIGGSLPQTMAINAVVTREKVVNVMQIAAIMVLLSSLLFRSFVGGLFVVIPLVLVVLANLGIMGWFGLPLDMSAATTIAMGIGIGADYEIYLVNRFKEELQRSRDISLATRATMLSAGKAVLFVAVSIIGGYAVLLTSSFSFYVRLGTTVMVTMSVAVLSALILVRAMTVLLKPKFIFGETVSDAPRPVLT